MLPVLDLLPGHHRRFFAGHPWVYANELAKSDLTKYMAPGTLVAMHYQNKPISIGYFNRHSLIAFRDLSRNPNESIDTDFFIRRLKSAAAQRVQLYDVPYYRLVHAESDDLPGLVIDRFNDTFVVQINTYGMERLKDFLIEALTKLFRPKTLYFPNDTAARKMEGLENLEPIILGEPLTKLVVIENGLEYSIDLTSGQKTGWFYDHRDNRQLIASLSRGKSVIDYFCYNGGFSLLAAKSGAKNVIGIDRSETALLNARETAERLNYSRKVTFVCNEAFKDMDNRIEANEKFEIVILDPPAFVKVKKDLAAGLKGYEKLISKGLQLLAPQGLLLIASCSYHVKLEDLKQCLAKALTKTHHHGKILYTLHAGPDHPMHPLLEESEYLKGFIVSCSSIN